MLTFTDSYLSTLQAYVGNEKALLFELTHREAVGKLADFLREVDKLGSQHRMLQKYTEIDSHGSRRFSKTSKTCLRTVTPAVEAQVRAAFRRDAYGATMTRTGWHAREWSDAYFKVLDVAARVGSGVGSYGVQRFYVLLAGDEAKKQNATTDDSERFMGSVILDVKFEPRPAVTNVLNRFDEAWYGAQVAPFSNEAARAVHAQRQLTSYTDPFTGWIKLNGAAYVVRQRSPWKAGFDLASLLTYTDLAELVQQLAAVTATSHARGTAGNAPAQFKEVVSAALGTPFARATWGVSVASIAAAYREQVLLDFGCFTDYVKSNFSVGPADFGAASSDDEVEV